MFLRTTNANPYHIPGIDAQGDVELVAYPVEVLDFELSAVTLDIKGPQEEPPVTTPHLPRIRPNSAQAGCLLSIPAGGAREIVSMRKSWLSEGRVHRA